jgi:hypothetical protein
MKDPSWDRELRRRCGLSYFIGPIGNLCPCLFLSEDGMRDLLLPEDELSTDEWDKDTTEEQKAAWREARLKRAMKAVVAACEAITSIDKRARIVVERGNTVPPFGLRIRSWSRDPVVRKATLEDDLNPMDKT